VVAISRNTTKPRKKNAQSKGRAPGRKQPRADDRDVLARTTELQKTIDALASERRRFMDVLDVLPAYVILLTPDYHVPFANRFFRERFGESHGKRCFEYLFGRSEPCEVCETYKVLKTMTPLEWEWTGPDSRNYDISDFPFTDLDGSTLILEMGIDATERKHVEAELLKHRNHLEELVNQRTEQLEAANALLQAEVIDRTRAEESLARERSNLQAVFDLVNVGMLLVDETGTVRRVNNAVSRWVGKEVSVLTGDQPGNLIGCVHAIGDPGGCGRTPHCQSCSLRSAFESVLCSGQPVHDVETETVVSVVGRDVHLWLEVNADPLMLEGKRHVIVAMNNIAARKQAELAQAQLVAQLQKANRELTEFAHVVSHDLKAPLRAVSSLAHILASDYADKLGPEGREHLELLAGRVKRMHMLIDGVLEYSRIGRVDEQRICVDLNEMVEYTIDLLSPPERVSVVVESTLP
jgi:PAS domain-containing protein